LNVTCNGGGGGDLPDGGDPGGGTGGNDDDDEDSNGGGGSTGGGSKGITTDPILGTCIETNTCEEDKIINELTGKADCVYQKMVNGNNSINWILENFEDTLTTSSEFDLILQMSNTLGSETNASTVRSGDTFTISINEYRAENINTALTIARTIIHEGIHARLREFASREGSDETSFPGVYDYFRIYAKNWDHQQMADHYRSTIAEGLKEYDNSQNSDSFYNALAWEGLAEIKDLNGDQDIIYTLAWSQLSPAQQQEILAIISTEKQNGDKNCQE
jgi:hypothetical protein